MRNRQRPTFSDKHHNCNTLSHHSSHQHCHYPVSYYEDYDYSSNGSFNDYRNLRQGERFNRNYYQSFGGDRAYRSDRQSKRYGQWNNYLDYYGEFNRNEESHASQHSFWRNSYKFNQDNKGHFSSNSTKRVFNQFFSQAQLRQIRDLEFEISQLDYQLSHLKKKSFSTFQLFENKQFNIIKKEMPHLSAKDIAELIYQQWKFKLNDSEREVYAVMAKDSQHKYLEEIEELMAQKNLLRKKIHDIKYSEDNFSVKPSGKLKYMSAFRFFRKEWVPLVKTEDPELDGKGRQKLIKDKWRELTDNQKFAYVQMSRADREKAIYVYRLTQIKENLINQFPDLKQNQSALYKIQQSIKDELEKVQEEQEFSSEAEDDSDNDEEYLGHHNDSSLHSKVQDPIPRKSNPDQVTTFLQNNSVYAKENIQCDNSGTGSQSIISSSGLSVNNQNSSNSTQDHYGEEVQPMQGFTQI